MFDLTNENLLSCDRGIVEVIADLEFNWEARVLRVTDVLPIHPGMDA